jgi:general secretion pathway protein H
MASPVVKATTRTSAPGSERGRAVSRRCRHCRRGFTLLELLVVLLLVAIASGVMTLALRDSEAGALEQEAARLAALLEMARAESRVSGQPVSWRPLPPALAVAGAEGGDFQFSGLSRRSAPAQRWLSTGRVQARVLIAQASSDSALAAPPPALAQPAPVQRLWLGPDAVLPPQVVELRRGRHVVRVASDGLAPFAPQTTAVLDAAGTSAGR